MTSQKRYRQHQESNNSARFRDLPPRFKRQKSSSTTSSPLPLASSLETQNNNINDQSLTAKTTNSHELINSSPGISPSMYPLDSLPSQHGSRAQILSTPQISISSSPAWQTPQKIHGGPVLSPWDIRHFDKVNNTQSHVPLGTHFGYKQDSPPLSPWASSISGHGAANSPVWKSSYSDPDINQTAENTSGYFRNENWAPTQNLWVKSSFQESSDSSLHPIRNHISPPAKQSEKNKINEIKSDIKQAIDYSDPDIRTIEMLRELERVADQKESECNDFGVDRKSLVSHHLRMLMCAVDRYTEGIEDFSMTRHDDVVSDSPRNSPGLDEVWQQKQIKEVKNEARSEQGMPFYSLIVKTSSWKDPDISPIYPASSHLTAPIHNREALCSSSLQASPVWENAKCIDCPENVAWDFCSNPSFDFYGVLTTQTTEQLTRDPFGRFKEKDERERKPLYQR